MRVHARRRLSTAARVVALALAAGVATTSCGRSGYAADDASANLERNLQLPSGPLDCMRQRFADDAAAAAVMDPTHVPSDEERAAFVAAARSCLPVDQFAALLAASLQVDESDESDPGVPSTSSGTADCVRVTIEAMTPSEQDQLYLHFSNPAALDADAVRDTSARLVSACGLGTDDPSGTVVGPVAPEGTTATEP